ncbi:hypothetical protein QJQ45_004421 [Haematococcus lacustris]|nr:hypothetical protein QJQ45_004421 [Haematococcus lacustris]
MQMQRYKAGGEVDSTQCCQQPCNTSAIQPALEGNEGRQQIVWHLSEGAELQLGASAVTTTLATAYADLKQLKQPLGFCCCLPPPTPPFLPPMPPTPSPAPTPVCPPQSLPSIATMDLAASAAWPWLARSSSTTDLKPTDPSQRWVDPPVAASDSGPAPGPHADPMLRSPAGPVGPTVNTEVVVVVAAPLTELGSTELLLWAAAGKLHSLVPGRADKARARVAVLRGDSLGKGPGRSGLEALACSSWAGGHRPVLAPGLVPAPGCSISPMLPLALGAGPVGLSAVCMAVVMTPEGEQGRAGAYSGRASAH